MEIYKLAPVTFVNNHASEIPPFGVMQITGAIADGNELVYEVTRPTSAVINYGSTSRFLFNGAVYVPNGSKGGGHFPSPLVQALVLPSSSVGLGNYLQFLSPVANEWYLGTGWHYEAILATDPIGVHEEGSARVWHLQGRSQSIFRLVTSSIVTETAGSAELQIDTGSGFAGSGVVKQVRSMLGDVDIGETCLAVVVNNMLRIIALCEGEPLSGDSIPFMAIEGGGGLYAPFEVA